MNNFVKILWCEKKENIKPGEILKYNYGHIEVEVNKDPKIYEKDFCIKDSYSRYRSSSESLARYVKWCDTHNLRKSSYYCLPSLRRSRKRDLYHLPFFDHTHFWRLEGEKYPCFCLTEPYCEKFDKNKEHIDYLRYEGYEVFWYEPSDYSLHNKNSTYMVFITDPKYFKFDEKYSRWG